MSFTLIGSTGTPRPSADLRTAATSREQTVSSPENSDPAKAADESQNKLQVALTYPFALVDSGIGGGMTAAYLYGLILQLASYLCLPIGDKPAAIATAYTAAMALWPLIAPLANENGENDGRVAENVIIACNSASVRREQALELMKEYCKSVANDKDNTMDIDPNIRANILALNAKVEADPNYFDTHVKEIVTETAKAGAIAVCDKLNTQNRAYVRIDSTNGTASSAAYPARFHDQLNRMQDVNGVKRETFQSKVTEGKDEYVINHDIFTFKQNGIEKVVVVESRGNPPWVPAIEDNKVSEVGKQLVGASTKATQTSLSTLGSNPGYQAFYSGLNEKFQNALSDAMADGVIKSDIHMLCCTHYPAMRPALEGQYNDPKVQFIDQVAIVADIAKSLDPDSVNPSRGPLNLVVTVGSQNYGGSDGYLRTSIPDGDATAAMLASVLQKTLDTRLSNDPDSRTIGSVQIFSQGEPKRLNPSEVTFTPEQNLLQHLFEILHLYIGGPLTDEILKEQGLMKNPDSGPDKPRYTLTPEARQHIIKPKITASLQRFVDAQTQRTKDRLNEVAELVTLGETRGIDTLALFNDQGAQLSAGVARIFEIQAHNDRNPDEKDRVGIMTGFTVVDNLTGDRKGGENDGPPGAVVLAKSVLQQGLPVTLVTDQSSEAALATALIGSGLARLDKEAEARINSRSITYANLKMSDLVLQREAANGMLQFEVPAFNNKVRTMPPPLSASATPSEMDAWKVKVEAIKKQRMEAVEASTVRLRKSRVTTMITIERPSVTEDGRMTSMVGKNISEFNLDMNRALRDESIGHVPFTIGAGGDGGNELGTGGIAKYTATLRKPDLTLVVKNGNHIAASPAYATDVMLLGSVSNHCGMVFALGINAYANQYDDEALAEKLDDTIKTYNGIINFMFEKKMSLDGVVKHNLLSVDGRPLGSKDQAEELFRKTVGSVPLGVGKDDPQGRPESTHNDMFLKLKNAFLATEPSQPTSKMQLISIL